MTSTTLGPSGPAMTPLAAGDPRSFGEYRTVGRLGAGGMGEAFLAERAGTWVVVKAAHPGASPELAARLAREVQALSRVHSSRVARVVASQPHGPRPWFAVEFVPGLTLAQRLAQHGPLAASELDGFAAGLIECLRDMQSAGVVHRDLKPENVVLTATGPRVIDFGAAEVDQATKLTVMGSAVGTVGWMAPEQVAGDELTPAVDVHAWGLLVLFAASGQPAFQADSAVSMMYRALHEAPFVPESLGQPLAGLVSRALAKEPGARPSVDEIADALGADRLHSTVGEGAMSTPSVAPWSAPYPGAGDVAQPAAAAPLWGHPLGAAQPAPAAQTALAMQSMPAAQPVWAGPPAGTAADRRSGHRAGWVAAGLAAGLAIAAVVTAANVAGSPAPADAGPAPATSEPAVAPTAAGGSPTNPTDGPDFARHRYEVFWDDGVTVHTGPGQSSSDVTWLPKGTIVHVVCRTRGEAAMTETGKATTWWDKIDTPVSGFITDARIDTGGYPPSVPLC